MQNRLHNELPASSEGAVGSLRRLAADLSGDLDSSWAVPMAVAGNKFVAVGALGDAPDVAACVENAATILAHYGALLGSGGVITQTDCTVIPLRVKGKIAAVVVLGPRKSGALYSPADRKLMVESAAQVSGRLVPVPFGRSRTPAGALEYGR